MAIETIKKPERRKLFNLLVRNVDYSTANLKRSRALLDLYYSYLCMANSVYDYALLSFDEMASLTVGLDLSKIQLYRPSYQKEYVGLEINDSNRRVRFENVGYSHNIFVYDVTDTGVYYLSSSESDKNITFVDHNTIESVPQAYFSHDGEHNMNVYKNFFALFGRIVNDLKIPYEQNSIVYDDVRNPIIEFFNASYPRDRHDVMAATRVYNKILRSSLEQLMDNPDVSITPEDEEYYKNNLMKKKPGQIYNILELAEKGISLGEFTKFIEGTDFYLGGPRQVVAMENGFAIEEQNRKLMFDKKNDSITLMEAADGGLYVLNGFKQDGEYVFNVYFTTKNEWRNFVSSYRNDNDKFLKNGPDFFINLMKDEYWDRFGKCRKDVEVSGIIYENETLSSVFNKFISRGLSGLYQHPKIDVRSLDEKAEYYEQLRKRGRALSPTQEKLLDYSQKVDRQDYADYLAAENKRYAAQQAAREEVKAANEEKAVLQDERNRVSYEDKIRILARVKKEISALQNVTDLGIELSDSQRDILKFGEYLSSTLEKHQSLSRDGQVIDQDGMDSEVRAMYQEYYESVGRTK